MPTLTATIAAVTHLDHVACAVTIGRHTWVFVTYTATRKAGRGFETREIVALWNGATSKDDGYSRARAAAVVWLREAAATRRLAATV